MDEIGPVINEVLERSGMSKSEFARRINSTPQNVQKILRRKSIDTELLLRIGEVLEHDFFRQFVKPLSPVPSEQNTRPYKVTVQLELTDPEDEERILRIVLGDKAFNQLKQRNHAQEKRP